MSAEVSSRSLRILITVTVLSGYRTCGRPRTLADGGDLCRSASFRSKGRRRRSSSRTRSTWPGSRRGRQDRRRRAGDVRGVPRALPADCRCRAGLADEFDDAGELDVIEDREGGRIGRLLGDLVLGQFVRAGADGARGRANSELTILQACWAHSDDVAARVSPGNAPRTAQQRPRPGHDHPRGHRPRREQGLREESRPEGPGARGARTGRLAPYRADYLDALRAYQRGVIRRPMRSWTLAFLVRRAGFHTMDHAWEIEDKDSPTMGHHDPSDLAADLELEVQHAVALDDHVGSSRSCCPSMLPK